MYVPTYIRLIGAVAVMVVVSACGGDSIDEKIVGTWYGVDGPRDQVTEISFGRDKSIEVYLGLTDSHAYSDRNAEATWELRPVEESDTDLHLLYVSERTSGRDETTTYPLSLVKFEEGRLLVSDFRSPQNTKVTSMEDLDRPPMEFAREKEAADS